MSTPGTEITELLNRAAGGDPDAARAAFPVIYQELRALASARARRLPPGATLQTTELVHEAYLRIVGRHPDGWQGMRHFYFTAARAMRDIVVDHARRRAALKRGGDQERVPLDDLDLAIPGEPEDVLALDGALERLERDDAEGHRFLMLRFYAGVSMAQASEILEVPLRTLERRWRFLRAWLARELEAAGS